MKTEAELSAMSKEQLTAFFDNLRTECRQLCVILTEQGIDFHDGFGHVLPGVAINCRCSSRTIIPAIGRGDIEGPQDLDAVTGYPGAYRAKAGKSAGPKQRMDVTKTRLPGEAVRYS